MYMYLPVPVDFKEKVLLFTVDGYLRNFNLRYIQKQHDNNRRSLHFFGLTIEPPYIR